MMSNIKLSKKAKFLPVNTDKEIEITDNRLFYDVREILNKAIQKTFIAVNSAMVEAYRNIRHLIVEKQGGEERAEYGDNLILRLSKQLTTEFGKGFTVANLKYMRQFYLMFPIRHALRDQLAWTHYRKTRKGENELC
jgi:hypothetical protein